ncbi:MAG: histone deacetylase [Acidobacteria bacterium]|nr:histone deacetylase [Acidobacteriota bacterium]
MATAIVHHPIYEKHDTGIGHTEAPRRYRAVMGALQDDAELWSSLREITPAKAAQGIVQAAHTPQHFKRVEGAFASGMDRLDADTVISMRSFDAALVAAGGAIAAVDAVMQGEVRNAFVAARPPGHHATGERAMGFCLFNNIAVAARYAQNKYKEVERAVIVDWDVHHGNGTQGIFYSDPSVFFFSMHQYPWYPGTGSRGETGQGKGLGTTLNVPVKAFTKAADQVHAFEAAIEEIASKIKPDIIFISAGFDAHLTDPLGQLQIEDPDFAAMTRVMMQWADDACGGRIVSCLEGGYNLETLGETVKNHVRVLNS